MSLELRIEAPKDARFERPANPEFKLAGPFYGEDADELNARFLTACSRGLAADGWPTRLVVIRVVEDEVPLL